MRRILLPRIYRSERKLAKRSWQPAAASHSGNLQVNAHENSARASPVRRQSEIPNTADCDLCNLIRLRENPARRRKANRYPPLNRIFWCGAKTFAASHTAIPSAIGEAYSAITNCPKFLRFTNEQKISEPKKDN
jgi:hypothetical protein